MKQNTTPTTTTGNQPRRPPQAEQLRSAHLGVVGQHITVVVEVLSATLLRDQAVPRVLHRLRDHAGNIVITTSIRRTLDRHGWYQIAGEVAEHRVWHARNEPQTVLRPCAVIHRFEPHMERRSRSDGRAEHNLSAVHDRVGGLLRWSRRGVPHLVIGAGTTTYSVCWFGKSRSFRVFWPYPGDGAEREHQDCATVEEVVALITAPRFREQAALLVGTADEDGVYTLQRVNHVDGTAHAVAIPWERVWARHQAHGDVVGAWHTHPPAAGTTPSPDDVRALQSWALGLGHPVVAVIQCGDAIEAWWGNGHRLDTVPVVANDGTVIVGSMPPADAPPAAA